MNDGLPDKFLFHLLNLRLQRIAISVSAVPARKEK